MRKTILAGVCFIFIGMGVAQAADKPIITGQAPEGQKVQEIVDMVQTVILKAMAGDKDIVAKYFAPNAELMFVGRKLKAADEIGKFNSTRYNWVKKSIDHWDVSLGENKRMVVTSAGTLYGEWPDGTKFEGNRFIDRFVLVDGKITHMDVWNDSAEILLKRAGLVKN